jgi:hypothetical protein
LCDGFFGDRVFQTICPGWLRTSVLWISASWIARITGVSHQRLAWHLFNKKFKSYLGFLSCELVLLCHFSH